MSILRRYIVVGPERIYVDRILDDGSGPSYPEHDVYLVDAPGASVAKWAAYRLAKKRGDRWYRDLDDEHPLSGTKVQYVPGEDPKSWGDLYTVADDTADEGAA